jgi:bifunctional N-acetylglucosamine-1-phosphate-uridyltransferase/glucosamine-1-phosphate-acetyltransferase GlmU-like protein
VTTNKNMEITPEEQEELREELEREKLNEEFQERKGCTGEAVAFTAEIFKQLEGLFNNDKEL